MRWKLNGNSLSEILSHEDFVNHEGREGHEGNSLQNDTLQPTLQDWDSKIDQQAASKPPASTVKEAAC
jgi:hypothetical protein